MFGEIIEIIGTYKSIKHLDLRNKGINMDTSQTLRVLAALNDSNAAANLHTLHLGHSEYEGGWKSIDYCDLSGEGASALLWAILQKAHNLKHLQLPNYMDITFLDGGVKI